MTQQTNLGPYTAGDTQDFDFHFTKDDGSDYDITNWVVYVTFKNSKSDSDDDAVFSADISTHTSPTIGETSLTMTATETQDMEGTYYQDIQVKMADGTVKTVVEGTVEFTEDVTNRTS